MLLTPNDIIEAAAALGVVLYRDLSGNLAFYGNPPPTWARITRDWLPLKDEVLRFLENPPGHHRARIARAMLARIRQQTGQACHHLGELLNPRPACGCGPLHRCGLHGEAVLHGNTPRYRICTRCPDYQAVDDG